MAKLCIVTSLADSCCYRHYSVWANGKVYHFNESGAHCQSEAEFMARRKLLRETEATQSDAEVEQYYQAHINSQYNAFFYNCEHFAYECAMGRKQSPTVRGYVLAAIVGVILAATIYYIKIKRYNY